MLNKVGNQSINQLGYNWSVWSSEQKKTIEKMEIGNQKNKKIKN